MKASNFYGELQFLGVLIVLAVIFLSPIIKITPPGIEHHVLDMTWMGIGILVIIGTAIKKQIPEKKETILVEGRNLTNFDINPYL